MREVAAEFERPVLLFSGGKDSIVLLRLAEKAFRPGPFPFPVMHVDTGHNFPEAIEFRDRRVRGDRRAADRRIVQDSIDQGRVVEETGPRASRNALQTVTLLDAIAEHGFDAAFGGARRDEERARAKERVLSFRDEFGQWEPQRQRPEVWASTMGAFARESTRASFRSPTGPSSTCGSTSPRRSSRCRRSTSPTSARCSSATGCSTRSARSCELIDGEEPFSATVRYRTVGDMSCTGAVESVGRDARAGRRRDRRDARSPSAARRAPTTASPRRRWRIASGRGTSDEDFLLSKSKTIAGTVCRDRRSERQRQRARRRDRRRADGDGDGGRRGGCARVFRRLTERPADLLALRHGRLGRRRQEHADRAPAVRLQAGAHRPARARRADERADGARLPRPLAADRRPARRARAGHHDRRRLPLLRDRAAALHHRRHAGPRAVHAQHGHRRLDGRPRDRADRRAQGRDRAVQAPRVHQLAAGDPARRRVRQQDGPRRLRRGGVRRRSSRSSTASRRAWRCPT